MKFKKAQQLFLLVFLISIALWGCSGGKKEDNSGNPPTGDNMSSQNSTGDSEEPTQIAGEPIYGGSIVVGITQDLDSLDPHKATAAGTREVLFNIFEGLVKPDEDGNLVPAVASDYKVSEDGLRYTFVLRDGVKFHNGELVTVEDIVYSIKRCAGLLEETDPSVRSISALSSILEVNAVDGSTVEIMLSEPNTELIGYMTFAIIPEDYDNQEKAPVGTGPFKFVSYKSFESFVMEANEDYYIEGVPYLDEVTFKISSDTNSAFMELLAGTIDIFPYLTESQGAQLGDLYNIETGNTNLVQALFLNNGVTPFDDVRVRQALCYAIDRQQILDLAFGGKGALIGSNMFPNFTKYFADELVNVYSYNVEKAKGLLADAGYPNGFEFTITVPSNYVPHINTAQVIVEQLKQVGITANIQLIEWSSWLSDVYVDRNYEATVIGLDSELAPGDILNRYNSFASKNFVNYKNEEFDKLYEKAVTTTDEQQKVEYYKELQGILNKDAASVYIQDPALLVAVNKKLGGYTFYPVYVQDMASVYYIEQK